VTVLSRGSLRWQRGAIPAPRAVEVLLHRAVPWLPELAAGLADRLDPSANAHDWVFVDAIVRAAGIAPPLTEGFTAGWISWVRMQPDPIDALARGPYAHYLLPMMFEHEGIGRVLQFTFHGVGLNAALAQLGRTDPGVWALLLDGCLARLLRGGRPGDLRPYVTLHEELAPDVEEIAARGADYAGLISAEPGPVAAMAQRCLRSADEAGRVEVDTLLDISVTALGRKEKSIVKTQATWLRQAARRHPDRAAELLALLDPAASVVPLPAPADYAAPVVPELPSPIATPAELAEELAALIAGDWSAPTVERVLDALVRLRHHDHAAFTQAVQPVVDANKAVLDGHWTDHSLLLLGGVLATLLDRPRSLRTRLTEAFLEHTRDHNLLKPLTRTDRSPGTLLEIRLQEIRRYGAHAAVPNLIATPTRRDGHIDPAVLLDRVETAERDGWRPWNVDLTQALLRLPRDVDAAVVRRARALSSPAGKELAQRLRDGHNDPVVTRCVQSRAPEKRTYFDSGVPDRRVVVALAPAGPVPAAEQALFSLSPPPGPVLGPVTRTGVQTWSAALPSHREVVAAWALPALARMADTNGGRGAGALLPLLAEAQGPTGPATALALAYGLSAQDAADRVAAVDALLDFGSSVDFCAAGAEIGEGAAQGRLKLNRAAAALHDGAEAGAVDQVWQVCLGALPGALRAGKPRPGTADLLLLAARCTRALGRGGPGVPSIEGLAELAGRNGSSQVVVAARELRTALGDTA
jgi:hypothetical protein